MDPVSILEQWLEPITSPLKDFRTQLTDLANIHEDTLKNFDSLVSDLTNTTTSDAFTGPAADAMSTSASDFLTIEQPMSDLLTITGPLEAIEASETALSGMMTAIFTAGGEVADTGPLATVTEVVDAAAAVQGGVDVPNDVAAAGLSLIEAAALVVILVQLLGTLFFIWITWQNTMNDLSNKMKPKLPDHPKPVQPPSNHFTNIDEATIQKLATEYGIDESDILQLLKYNPDYTESELRAILDKYRAKKAQYPNAPTTAFLLALAMDLPDSVLKYLTHMNDKQTNSYLKGKPNDDPYTDILAALLGQLTLDAKTQFTQMQSAARKGVEQLSDEDKKDPLKKEQAIINAVEATGVAWESLPSDVQDTLLGKYGTNYRFGYGKSIEALVKQYFHNDYPLVENFYKSVFGLVFNQPLPDNPGKKPDMQLDPSTFEVQITEDGKVNVIDITSQKNMDDKLKYDLDIVWILIALAY